MKAPGFSFYRQGRQKSFAANAAILSHTPFFRHKGKALTIAGRLSWIDLRLKKVKVGLFISVWFGIFLEIKFSGIEVERTEEAHVGMVGISATGINIEHAQ